MSTRFDPDDPMDPAGWSSGSDLLLPAPPDERPPATVKATIKTLEFAGSLLGAGPVVDTVKVSRLAGCLPDS